MPDKYRTDQVLGIVLWFVAASGVHWLITPAAHPDASTLRHVWVWIQVVVCGVAGWRLVRRARRAVTPP